VQAGQSETRKKHMQNAEKTQAKRMKSTAKHAKNKPEKHF